MDHCKYHPLEASTYHCQECQISVCDSCIDESDGSIRCVSCGAELVSLGAGSNIEPFWRRLDKAFRYPMTQQALILIFGASLLSSFSAHIGGLTGFILSLLVTGVTTKYSFMCLQQTADGGKYAPQLADAYSGGVKIVLHIILIFAAISFMIIGVGSALGEVFASIVALFWFFCLPAVFINYGRSESIGMAINPMEISRLVFKLGRSYMLLLLFVMIMIASVGTLHHIFKDFSAISSFLQSLTSYYYMIVVFHLMGYLLFQKQRLLGFATRFDDDEMQVRTDKIHFLDKVEVLVKEGRLSDIPNEFRQAFKQFPNELDIYNRYFDFLCGLQNEEGVKAFFPDYVRCLQQAHRQNLIPTLLQRIYQFAPDLQFEDPAFRHELAQLCFESHKFKLSVKLLNGLFRSAPHYSEIAAVYQLMADALDELPNKTAQAEKCREMAEKLDKEKAQ